MCVRVCNRRERDGDFGVDMLLRYHVDGICMSLELVRSTGGSEKCCATLTWMLVCVCVRERERERERDRETQRERERERERELIKVSVYCNIYAGGEYNLATLFTSL